MTSGIKSENSQPFNGNYDFLHGFKCRNSVLYRQA